jgi:hypothetical protein
LSISDRLVRRRGTSDETSKEITMRFLMYKLGDENEGVPELTPEQQVEMGKVAEDATKAGALVFNCGIAPTSMGTKLVRSGGEFTVTDGPFTEAKELIGGWGLIEARDKDEAIEWAKRFQAAAGDGEMRVRQIFGSEG